MNTSQPDKTSPIYASFLSHMNQKVDSAIAWLSERNIEYIWNNWIDNHLYRLYIPEKDLLLDFEYYPVIDPNYNYVRVNFDTNIENVLARLFPETMLDTEDMTVWKLTQKAANKFLRENGAPPIYYKDVLRLGYVKDMEIYQCIIIRRDTIIADVTKKDCKVAFGTYMLLRYLNEAFGFDHIKIRETFDNSYINTFYQLLGLPAEHKSPKRKVWWSPDKVVWRTDHPENYIPFYLTESVTYTYPKENP